MGRGRGWSSEPLASRLRGCGVPLRCRSHTQGSSERTSPIGAGSLSSQILLRTEVLLISACFSRQWGPLALQGVARAGQLEAAAVRWW